ncbi:RNA polymerase sigma factor [Mucilaginibacter sp. McL0603]|uniref:RNA polymerase sigma factor n=1 Tax=Mucilaginibacter sp. McL0603 TaxID=3415670 RepID=UPI003CEBEF3C
MNNKETLFLQTIEQNKGMLFKICKIYQDNPEDQDDLLQEIILQLWVVFDSFRGESKISSWMYRVALNTAIVFFKKQKRRPDIEQLPQNFDHPDAPVTSGEKEEQLAVFYKAVQQLDKVERALIFLYMENRSYQEISASLGITQVNLRVRLNRVKNKLKDLIKEMNYEY